MLKVLLISLNAIAQSSTDAAAVAPQQAPAWMQFVPFVIIIGVFYFFIIRPQATKQKAAQNFLSGLKNGDLVITHSGIYGRVTALTDLTVMLEVDKDVHIKFLRSQISMPQSALQVKKEGK